MYPPSLVCILETPTPREKSDGALVTGSLYSIKGLYRSKLVSLEKSLDAKHKEEKGQLCAFNLIFRHVFSMSAAEWFKPKSVLCEV